MNTLIIDVRSKLEYFFGHKKGSKNVPLGSLGVKIHGMAQVDDPIWVCCASGHRSHQAKQILESMGYKNVIDKGPWTNLV